MINYGFRTKLPDNNLYTSQIGAMLFICGFVFKVSSLPGLVSQKLMSSGFWAYIIFSIFEIVSVALIYIFMANDGFNFLTEAKSKAFKVLMFVIMIFLTLKAIVYFSFLSRYLTTQLFEGQIPFLVVVVSLAPIMYLAYKGIRTIGRVSEIFAPIFFIVIILNLAFINTQLKITNLLPVFAVPVEDFFKDGFLFGLWFGDLMPLLFVSMSKKKLPYVGMSLFSSAVLIFVVMLFGVALYGESLPFVPNLLITIAGYNQLSSEIGRMDWTALITVLIMAIIAISYNFWAINICFQKIFKAKKPVFLIFFLIVILAITLTPSIQWIIMSSVSVIGYVMLPLAILLPTFALIIYVVNRKKANLPLDNRQPVFNKQKKVSVSSQVNDKTAQTQI